MPKRRRFHGFATLAVLAAPFLVFSSTPVPHNRERLEEIRQDPQKYADLLQKTRAFLKLPKTHQDRLRALDEQLYQLSESQRDKLIRVMKSYAVWRAQLSKSQRRQIDQAPNEAAKLALIQQLRQQQWLARLPKIHRDKLAELHGQARACYIDELRVNEKRWQAQWQLAFNHWGDLVRNRPLPASLAELKGSKLRQDKMVYVYVTDYLYPRLSDAECERLQQAEGNWPLFPCTLVEVADKHPLALPGERGPTSFHELPLKIQKLLLKSRAKGALERQASKTWPEFGTAVAKVLDQFKLRQRARGNLLEYLPVDDLDLSVQTRGFVEEQLKPLLNKDEKAKLQEAQGHWPEYPQTIHDLAKKYDLFVPWQTLPGPRSRWDSYRVPNYELITSW